MVKWKLKRSAKIKSDIERLEDTVKCDLRYHMTLFIGGAGEDLWPF